MIKIALIAGHNFRSQGVRRKLSSEFVFANGVIEELLETAGSGYELKQFTRKYHGGSYTREMRELHKRVDAWGADISMEFHFNASESSARGHEVLYYHGSTGGSVVAHAIDRAFDNHITNRDRNVKKRGKGQRGSFGLRVGKSKSVILEPFFAKELKRFVVGGDLRQPMLTAYIEAFQNLADINNVKEANYAIYKPTALWTEEELAVAMNLLNSYRVSL